MGVAWKESFPGEDDPVASPATLGEMRRRLRELEGLAALGRIGSAGYPREAFFDAVTAQAARLLNAEICVILLLQSDAGLLRPALPASGVANAVLAQMPSGVTSSPVVSAIFDGAILGTVELVADESLAGLLRATAGNSHSSTAMATRLYGRSAPIGVLLLCNRTDGAEFDEDDRDLVEQLAAQIGPLLEGFQLYEESQAERKMLDAVLSQMVEGVIMLDSSEKVLYTNRAFARLLGEYVQPGVHRRDYLRHVHFADLEGEPIPPEGLPLARSLRQGEVVTHEVIRWELPDGTRTYLDTNCAPLVDAHGQVSGVVSVYRDITQQVASEQERERLLEELEANEGRLRVILEAMDDAVAVFHDGRVVVANRRYREFFGLERDIVGHSLDDLIQELSPCFASADRYRDALRQLAENPASPVTVNLETLQPEHRYLQYTSSPLLGPDGDYFGRIELYRDVTDLRVLEQQKDEFLASAGIELQGPLTIIKGYGSLLKGRLAALHAVAQELLQQTGFDLEAVRQQLANLTTEVDHLLGLAGHFRDLMRLEAEGLVLYPGAVNLLNLATAITEHMKRDGLLHQVVVQGLQGEDLTAFADDQRLRQVVSIMIENAARYSAPTQPIEVYVVRLKRAGESQATARIIVQDRGIGLEAGEARQVFTRFYRGDQARQIAPRGLGISLYLAEAIIRHHGGRMWAESDGPGRGSRFIVELPLLV